MTTRQHDKPNALYNRIKCCPDEQMLDAGDTVGNTF